VYALHDALWNTTALLDVNGNVLDRFAYSPYGVVETLNPNWTPTASPSIPWAVLFRGYFADEGTGLLHARARQFSPTLGRFVSRDPAKYINGLSLYRAYFTPNRLDPSGKWCDSDCSTAGAKSDYAVDDIDVVRAAAGNTPPGVVRIQGGDLIAAIERFNNVQNIANIAAGATQGLADAATAAADSFADSFFGGNENLGAGGSATEGVVDRLDGIFNDVPPGQAMIIWVHVKWKICTHHWCCWPIWDKLTKDDGGGDWYRFPEFGIEGLTNDSNRANAIRDAAVNGIQKATAP
jgi:RHS repeat-associated protein